MTTISTLTAAWGSLYANHAVLRTLVTFAHVASLLVGGGAAIAADRATFTIGLDDTGRDAQLDALQRLHRLVAGSLLLIGISGLLMFAADADGLYYSRIFWIKMAIVVLLAANGGLLDPAPRHARAAAIDRPGRRCGPPRWRAWSCGCRRRSQALPC